MSVYLYLSEYTHVIWFDLFMLQNDIAKELGIKQPTVAMIEKPGRDLKISSLKQCVEANGGKLRFDVEFPDGTHFGFGV